jgi:TolB-like protein
MNNIMKKNITLIFLLLGVSLLLQSCRSTTLKDIERSEFSTSPEVSSNQVKEAILRACKKRRWKINAIHHSSIISSFSSKKNKFGAQVRISYDQDSYNISYLNSHNLKYSEHGEKGEETESFFTEYNPFSDSEEENNNHKPTTIHKRYFKWVKSLDKQINSELRKISKQRHKRASRSKSVRTPIKTSYQSKPSQTINCNDEPLTTESGTAKITKNSVNIRSGANTGCALLGSVSANETFTLLGRKNNWYYISLNQNQKAWIYEPFVKRVDDNMQEVAQTENVPPIAPAPKKPVAPTKNISIAVIQFKTLNKKAQEISLGELVSETFTSALVNSQGFKIIEREQLDKVVKEMEMNQTGFIETTDAVEIGKILHADAIITGSVTLLHDQIQLNARIIEIESAYVISAETKTTTYTLQNITNIANEIVAKLSRKLLDK